jgi:chromate transporter
MANIEVVAPESPGTLQQDAAEALAPKPTAATLALFFLRLGTLAFGGPAAHIAMMEDELVSRRKWVSRERFMDLFAVANLIPGPSSTELAIYLGYDFLGVRGLLLAGTCFILPAFLMVLGIACAYRAYGTLPTATSLLYGVKPVLIPILLQAAWRLGKSAIKSKVYGVLVILGLTAALLGYDPLVVLLSCGLLGLLFRSFSHPKQTLLEAAPILPATGGVVASIAAPVTLGSLFLVFLKIGAVVFGSGYVLLTFLRTDLVVHRHWLTEAQLLDSVAVGQVTPGPVFTTATFIGYILAGLPGAVVATVGIFLPAFVLVGITGPVITKLRKWTAASAFLDGLNVGSIALIVAVAWELGRVAVIDVPTIVIASICAVLLLRFKVNSTWLVLGGGIIGVLTTVLGLRN